MHWTADPWGPRIAWYIYIGGITFSGSHLFVAITALNLDGEYGAASLFRSYQSKSCDSVATILDTRAFQVLETISPWYISDKGTVAAPSLRYRNRSNPEPQA